MLRDQCNTAIKKTVECCYFCIKSKINFRIKIPSIIPVTKIHIPYFSVNFIFWFSVFISPLFSMSFKNLIVEIFELLANRAYISNKLIFPAGLLGWYTHLKIFKNQEMGGELSVPNVIRFGE